MTIAYLLDTRRDHSERGGIALVEEVARAPFDASLPMPAEREGAEVPIASPMAAVLNRPPPQRAAIDHTGG